VADDAMALGHPALFLERSQRRYYPQQSLASQVIGFVDNRSGGRSGIERSMQSHLQGGAVLLQRRRDRRGLDVDRMDDSQRGTTAGRDVHTTLDSQIQFYAEQALEGVVERHEPAAVMAVVVDVHTGDILALANAPSFNPNSVGADPAPRRNRVIQDAVEPGSVFKPFTVAAAIEEGLVQPETLVDCELGRYRIGRAVIGDDHPKGVITASEVIKYSSNIGSAKFAQMLGAQRFLGYLRDFGFGHPTGVELPGERSGFVRSAENIKPIEMATTAYGQGVTATALQLAMGTSALANGGRLMKPRLVIEVTDEHGVPEFRTHPEVVAQVISPETARKVAEMMVTVTEQGGTATRAQVDGFKVAGKTGTAWKVENGAYGTARIGSFIGFVPADDPVLAIVVVVDEPSVGSRYGGIVAAPAFSEIAGRSLRYLGVAPDPALEAEPVVEPEIEAEPDLAPESNAVAVWSMPDLEGEGMRGALASLQGLGLELTIDGSGSVISQTPTPGTPLAAGMPVTVVLQ
jgi:cell division protein FtsI (penicillin-binding protein 3)